MDTLTKVQRSERMKRIRSRDTRPELTVRRLLHALNYRYRVHLRGLPGTPDIAFTRRKKVIFVHGCFWHQHTGCTIAHIPKSRREYWAAKLKANAERDMANCEKLALLGWKVLIVWECQLNDLERLRRRLGRFLR